MPSTYNPSTIRTSGGGGSTFDFPTLGGNVVVLTNNQAFVFAGDSITYGHAAAGNDWPTQAMVLSQFAGLGTKNIAAASGWKLADIQGRYATDVYPLRPTAAGTQRSILFVWIGSNDLATSTASDWLTAWTSYVTTAKADGFYVVAFTIMKRTDALAYESVRTAINAGIMASAVPDLVVDMAAIFTNPADNAYFAGDGLHPSDTTMPVIAGVVNAALSGFGRNIGQQHDLLSSGNTWTGANKFYANSGSQEALRVDQDGGFYLQTWYVNGSRVADMHPSGTLECVGVVASGDISVGGTLSVTNELAIAVNNSGAALDLRQNGGGYVQIWRNSSGTQVADLHPSGTLECVGVVATGAVKGSNVKQGTGSPEGAVTGSVGDMYQRTDGGAGTTLYVKESGTGNTGWVAK